MIHTWVLSLPYRTPPLSLNRKLHHMVEHRVKGELKQAAHLMARHLKLPQMKAITAELVWFKGDNRKADSDNIAPTLKPILDGLVAAGVLADDDSTHVLRTSTRVVLKRDDPNPHGGPRVVLKIRDMSALHIEERL